MISLLADRIDSSSAAALQGVGKSALRDMRERSVNRRDGGRGGSGEREKEIRSYSTHCFDDRNRIIERILYICMYVFIIRITF